MQKIVITGALGYIGVELCKLYFEDKATKVIAMDNRFTAERVGILRNKGIEFVCGDILDNELMRELLKDADVVYHLAGITDVAYTKFESNEGKDLEIRRNGIQGTLNVINNMPANCKLIFPSTHVVYEGVEETILNIEEDYPTKTLLTYATQKVVSEQDIKKSGVRYTILRLGSVYGHSHDTTRMNIMPQLFSKIASQNGVITLFGGDNYKSLVSVFDVARAMKYFSQSTDNETYHLTNENMTIREVANICKKYNPKLTVRDGDKQTYSPSYTLSNKKLLEAGFSFNYNIDQTIKSMIYAWSDAEGKEYIKGFLCEDMVTGLSDTLLPVVSLGSSPLANNLLDSEDQPYETYPLEVMFCPESLNCQLSYVVNPDKMFKHYLYVSSTSSSFRKHFQTAAESYIQTFNLNADSLVVDIGSNDGIALTPFKEANVKVLGIEPSKNVAEIALQKGIPTVCKYFDTHVAYSIVDLYGAADLVLASNVFAHSANLSDMLYATFKLLKEDGVFIVEVQYILDTIRDLTFDNIYHEHVNYWSVHSLNTFVERHGLKMLKVEHIDTHGGSIRAYIGRPKAELHDSSVQDFLENERAHGLTEYKTYAEFGNKVAESKVNVKSNMDKMRRAFKSIVGYGAPAKATTMLNYYEIDKSQVDYVVDDNPLKHGKYIPGTGIPIYSKDKLQESKPDVVLVFAWNFFKEIVASNSELVNSGVRFISIKELQSDTFEL